MYTDCTMWLINDDVYEGVERLYLELDYTPMDTGVRIFPGRRRAIIYIHDSDDGKLLHTFTEFQFHKCKYCKCLTQMMGVFSIKLCSVHVLNLH